MEKRKTLKNQPRTGQKLGYIRVSTIEQNEERQKVALDKIGIDKYFMDKASGKDTNRQDLKRLLEYAREGDTVYIVDFSRLARNVKDLLDITEMLNKKGVALVSLKENLDTSTPTGKLMLTVIGAIYEFQRAIILESQAEGIAVAKAKGKFKGKQVKQIKDIDFNLAYTEYCARVINKTQFAKKLNISRPTLDKLLKDKGIQ